MRLIGDLEVPRSCLLPCHYLDLFSVGNPEFNSSTALCKQLTGQPPHWLRFLIVYVTFEIFVYLFTVSPISTTVLNTFAT